MRQIGKRLPISTRSMPHGYIVWHASTRKNSDTVFASGQAVLANYTIAKRMEAKKWINELSAMCAEQRACRTPQSVASARRWAVQTLPAVPCGGLAAERGPDDPLSKPKSVTHFSSKIVSSSCLSYSHAKIAKLPDRFRIRTAQLSSIRK